MNRFGTLPCDLCDARLNGRAAFDAHYRDVHGTVSIKPRSILARAKQILASMPGGPPPPMSAAAARAKIAEMDKKVVADADRERRLHEALEEDRKRLDRDSVRRLHDGWLTARFPAGAVDFPLTSALDEVSESDVQYVYLKDGSYLQVRTEKDRQRVLGYLREFDGEFSSPEAREQAKVVESMTPWQQGSNTHRYGG